MTSKIRAYLVDWLAGKTWLSNTFLHGIFFDQTASSVIASGIFSMITQALT